VVSCSTIVVSRSIVILQFNHNTAHLWFLGHVAVSGKRSIDFLLQTFFEGFLKGGSVSTAELPHFKLMRRFDVLSVCVCYQARWWRNRHNKHHAQPNRIGVDGDLATAPLFAWDQKLAKKCFSWVSC
jgi:hypothetical protein